MISIVVERGISDRYGGIACFSIAALAYFILRSSLDIVWNDTGTIAVYLFLLPLQLASIAHKVLAHPVQTFIAAFASVEPDGYRPLSGVWNAFATPLVGSGALGESTWVAFVSLLQGATAASIYRVARRVGLTSLASALAAMLALTTAPAVASQWVILVGYQNLVVLITCCGLLGYWRWLRAGNSGWPWLVALALVLFFGPLVREFTGILLATLLLWLEIGVRGRPSAVAFIALLGFMHTLFPTAAMKLLFFHDLPLKSVFALGAVDRQMELGQATPLLSIQYLRTLRWQAIPFALLLIPPSLTLCAGVSLLLPGPEITLAGGRLRFQPKLLAIVFLSGLCVIGIGAAVRPHTLLPDILLLWLLIGVALVGFRLHPLLPAWLLVATLPFLRVFNQETHLLYAGAPAAIIACGGLQEVWKSTRRLNAPVRRRAIVIALTAVALIGASDQLCNLAGSYLAVRQLNRAEHLVSDWLTNATPDGTKVVTNAVHGYDLQLFSAKHVLAYWTRGAGVPDPSRVVETSEQLQRVIDSAGPTSPVYFLDVDYDFASEKIAYHSHRFLWGPAVAVQPVGRITTISQRYPYFDPIKLFVPRAYTSYLGPPDLVDDFYHGPALDGSPFLREFFAVYDLYRVTGKSVGGWVPSPSRAPYIIDDGFHGFQVWQWGNGFFGLPASPNIPSNRTLLKVDRTSMCLATTEELVKSRILAGSCPTQVAQPTPTMEAAPQMVGMYRGFDIFRADEGGDTDLIAIPQGEAPLHIADVKRGDYLYRQWFIANDEQNLRKLIDALPHRVTNSWPWLDRPDLLGE